MHLLKRFALLLAAVLAAPVGLAQAGGTLFIVGGGLQADNRQVYEAFVTALPRQGKIVVIPTASASPVQSARSFSSALQQYGLPAERIEMYPLAMLDDAGTPDEDESRWRENAWDAGLVAGLGEPAAVWFTGGDQTRIMEALIRNGRETSPLLALIRERLAAGAVVGGASAGAAIMSRHMISGGESFEALLQPVNASYNSSDEEESGRLLLSGGAGFLPQGLVDQHFGARARLGRLVRALAETGERFGYGIGEDTAMVVDLASGQATVLGRGGVTLLDASGAEFDFDSGNLVQGLAHGLAIGYAAPGARFPLGRCELAGDIGSTTRGRESSSDTVENGGGMAFAPRSLEALLGPDLLDNSVSRRLERFSMRDDGRLLIYAFSETADSAGFRKEGDGPTRYSACKLRFDVTRASWEIVRDRP